MDESYQKFLRKYEQLKYDLQTELSGLNLQTEMNLNKFERKIKK